MPAAVLVWRVCVSSLIFFVGKKESCVSSEAQLEEKRRMRMHWSQLTRVVRGSRSNDPTPRPCVERFHGLVGTSRLRTGKQDQKKTPERKGISNNLYLRDSETNFLIMKHCKRQETNSERRDKLAQFSIHCSLTAQYSKLVVALFSRLNSSA
jgi:hypothetical protein